MTLLISTAALTSRFRIVETVTNLQQVTRRLIGLRHYRGDRRSNQALAIHDLRPTEELAEDFFAEDLFAEDLGKA